MEVYEKFKIREISHLKSPTIYCFLKANGISETYIRNLRKNSSSILLNGTPANTRTKIAPLDTIEISKSPSPATQTNLCEGTLDILFEDEDFLVVNKPHNLACTPTRSHFGMNLGGQICKYMQEKDPNFVLRILNRLDRETAGIVVVAKNLLAYSSFSKSRIQKEYHAIARGNIYENITIDKPILTVTKDGINEIKRVISPEGKRAVTHVEVVKNFDGLCHVKLSLETGRTHQIRVHLSSIGHPLLGDTLYGQSPATTCAKTAENTQPNHTMLILKKISFKHFRTEKNVSLEVPFPPEWKNFA